MVWEDVWICLDYFLQHMNELDFDRRLNKHNHKPLFPYLVTPFGACFPLGQPVAPSTTFCSNLSMRTRSTSCCC